LVMTNCSVAVCDGSVTRVVEHAPSAAATIRAAKVRVILG
jgi:hypothetical protein